MNISVRFTPEGHGRLRELVEHFSAEGRYPYVGAVTPSSIIRYAVERLYEEELGRGRRKR